MIWLNFVFLCCLAFLLPNSKALGKDSPVRIHDRFVVHAIPKCGTHLIQRLGSLLTNQSFIHSGEINFTNELLLAERTNRLLRLFIPYNVTSRSILEDRKYKTIAMVRDPRDALISMLFYMRRNWNGSTKRDFFVVDEDFDRLTLNEQISRLIAPQKNGMSYINYYLGRLIGAGKVPTLGQLIAQRSQEGSSPAPA